MIVWSEQQPDFHRKVADDLFRRLPFTATCAVVLGNRYFPKVVVSRRVIHAIWAHLSEQAVEMGGLLIGSVHNLDEGDYRFVVAIEEWVRSDEYDGTSVSLRMNTGVWDAARAKANDNHSVIGWYHSHPNLGAFFSGTDRRTQGAFFNHPHCLGLVVDPIRNEEKWFIGGESQELRIQQVLQHG